MKSLQLSDIILMLMMQESFLNRNASFWHFFVPLLTRWYIDITMSKRHQDSTRQTESVSQRAGCRQPNE